MDFRQKLDYFMKDNSINNLNQLALKCDIPYTTLRDCYEKNNADNSRMLTIRKLAKYMNCTTDYLAYDELIDPSQSKIDGSDFSFLNNNSQSQTEYDDKIKELETKNGVKILYSTEKPLTQEDYLDINQLVLEVMKQQEKK